MGYSADVSDENAVGVSIRDEFKKPFLAGFLDSRGGEEDLSVSVSPRLSHRILVAADVFIIDEDLFHTLIECREELLFRADEDR